MKHSLALHYTQRGVSAVEFAFVAAILLLVLFGIVEFGRLFFTINSMQEITRRAAREQVVNWVTAQDAVKRVAVLRTNGVGPGTVNFPNSSGSGTVNFPGSPDVQNVHVQLDFLNKNFAVIAPGTLPSDVSDNIQKCVADENTCIKFVRATLANNGSRIAFADIAIFGFVPFVIVPSDKEFLLPYSTVVMPAEALGLL